MDNFPFFSVELLIRIHHYGHSKLGRKSTPYIVAFLIIFMVVMYIYHSAKKNSMIKKLGFASKEHYEAYKKNCKLNYQNRFCMSDEWVINEYSYKFYHTNDITSASPTHKMKKGSKQYDKGYIYGIIIGYHGGADQFNVNGIDERDRLLKNINEFIKCHDLGTDFVQDCFSPSTPEDMNERANEAIRKKYENDNNGWL